MCFCWEGALACFWSRCRKDDTVVDVPNGAKPDVHVTLGVSLVTSLPRSPPYNRRNCNVRVVTYNELKTATRNPSVQHMSSDGNNGGNMPSTPNLESELCHNCNVRAYKYNELKTATRNFHPDSALGEGGFGVVYKGWIDEIGPSGVKIASGMIVAVKVLSQDGRQGHRKWLAEVNFLGQLHHPHLVKLIGYSCEDEHRLLVYEFMQRGSLEKLLFQKMGLPLSWATRMKIALGAVEGLAFLHGAERPVIFRDFKTSNILLDSDYSAKLSDFGLAKDGPEVCQLRFGDYRCAPDNVTKGHLTSRSDVYSFGVVLLELLTGRRSMDQTRPAGEQNLVEWALPYLRDKRRLLRIVDPRLDGQYSVKGAQKAASLAYDCLNTDPIARPLMSDVVDTLEPLQNMRDIASASYTYIAGSGTIEGQANAQSQWECCSSEAQCQPSTGTGPIRSQDAAADFPVYQRSPRKDKEGA